MKVRYTRRALRQLAEILDYIDARSPQGADNVKRRLQAVIELLADHPNSGRLTSKNGIRRAVARPYPYLIFYRPDTTGIVIHGVRHAARRSR
ncbi:type II toxin-antitoxin system RelE/ParE family toxin [Bradyrhizobium sp. AZCC 1719]|uniref:type II toxin-antitoxin system RelE/ParE family toxin n=1 Tax=Bradyrhizobium sp. AZCC 1719 TaxID=3117028 RepID=UPI002FF01247